ncbi:MAG: tetraacyldisaccharide 4'-kinase [Gammaproteobacteria bacterium]|nr:tetraacyldisaccharide 4'-kinase [Gammaproteobacteria bacterium]MBQ0840144.1 tetraacyldisaccharide 4'-kinase [Gammaproteobacteria bacterium]
MSALERAWYKPRSWALALLPLSYLFRGVAAGRKAYLQSRYQAQPFAVPVVVVGNIAVGGTGKTPLIISLVHSLQAAGIRPGIVSRGYGGQPSKQSRKVAADSSAQEFGDEPVLIAREANCPVVVDSDRVAAVKFLIDEFNVDVVLSDDGLQHYRMHRDLEIAVLDARRGLGNAQCLPAGPLREPPGRLASVDFIVLNGASKTHSATFSSAATAVVNMTLEPTFFRHLRSGQRVAANDWSGARSVHALAGIGNPERFSNTLLALGLEPQLHRFPDHHPFTPADLQFDDALAVVMTSKDAVKCEAFAADNVWVLEVAAEVSPPLAEAIKNLLV